MADFRVQGQLGLDGSGFFSTMGKARGAVSSFAGSLAGAFSVGAIAAFSKSVLDLAGHLNDVSEALSINVEFLQRFLNSARTSGGDLGDIEKFMFAATQARQKALNDTGGADAKAFSSLGISSGEISSATTQQILEKIIKSISAGATDEKLNALTEIGGKSAKKLVGAFRDGLDQATPIMTEALIIQLDEIGDRFITLASTLRSIFAPAILWVINAIQAFADTFNAAKAYYKTLFSTGSVNKSGEALTSELLSQSARDKQSEKRLADRIEARHRSERSPAGLVPDAAKETSQKKHQAYSDSLLAVGNFLGAGTTSSLQSVAEKQLAVMERIATAQFQLLDVVRNSTGGLLVGL